MSDIQKNQKVDFKTNANDEQIKARKEIERLEQTLANLQEKKEKMMTDLKHAIEEEKNDWLETKERERQEAKDLGYKIGYDEGIEHGERQWEEKIQEANRMTEIANRDYHRTIEKHEDAILNLSIAVAEKIMKEKLADDYHTFLPIVKHAIEELKERANIVIYVHPTKYHFLVEQKDELEQLLEEDELLSIYADKQLKDEDCVIKHPFGQIEVGIDTQLHQIKNVLAEKIAEEL